tara:strand:+ start:175 stop:591 length:417 start_codon:yes stop_codon:yes gene_type:complete
MNNYLLREKITVLNKELEEIHSEIFIKIGEKISQKRKKKRRKVKGISKKLNISTEFLDFIEKGNFLKIPEHVPRLGFVKSYAKYLEVDISSELSQIDSIKLNSVKDKSKKFSFDKGLKKFIFFFLFFTFFMIILLFFK